MTPVAGKLSDIYGKKKVLLIIMIFYTVGVSIAGFSTNIDFMLIARGFQGVGISMFPIAFSIVRCQFPFFACLTSSTNMLELKKSV